MVERKMLSPKEREKQAKQARTVIILSGILLLLGGVIGIIAFMNWIKDGISGSTHTLLVFSIIVLLGGFAVAMGGYGLPEGKLLDGISFGYSLGLLGFIGTIFAGAWFHAINVGKIFTYFFAALSLEFLGLLFGLYVLLSVSVNLLKTFLFPTLPK